ncbi:glycosyltransferase family 4 protein [Pseudoalteromonas sp.]|uniref:glycosyltransferase family 4 protein n=1 Tax=Pseudoalteromonas sp. TaxID=53249 RepID=UPI0025E71967|nr:glycosyltransferase family 4 protein [Pseudoalteromonas sp.]
MNVVLVSQWFPPEQAPIGYMLKELAQQLVAQGHQVTVITGFPNHPRGEVFGGYKKQWVLEEQLNGIRVLRCWLATSPKRSVLDRVMTFLSFTFTSGLALLRRTKPDLIFGVMQPLSVGVTLPLLAKVKKAKLILNVQDLHPDVPIELGMIKNPLMIKLLRAVERYGYKKADGLAVICEPFKNHCAERGAKADNIAVIPNWLDLDEIKPQSRINEFRTELGLSEDDFVMLFAGTVGWVSGAGIMIEVAEQLKDLKQVKIVFVGEGPLVPELKQAVADKQLNNVLFAPFQPREKLNQVQAMSDLSVVSMHKGKGSHSVPSKVLGYMAAGRALIASVDSDSETANMIKSAGAGWITPAEDALAMARQIKEILADPNALKQRGQSGRSYLEQHFTKEIITGQYIEFFSSTVAKS